MNIVKGQVTSNVDYQESGAFYAKFPKLGSSEKLVTYTSPYFKVNGGGFLGIPTTGDEVLAFYNEDPGEDENDLYYISTVVSQGEATGTKNRKFKPIPNNDVSPYNKGKPVGQRFTNETGAGFYIQRNYEKNKISNNVTMRAETGEEVNVGAKGVQITNPDGDCIVLTGPESDALAYGSRALHISTDGPQEFKCLTGDINMRIDNGGDINIENNSWGLNGIPPWSGNIRLKSRWKDVTLAALSEEPLLGGKVHIVTVGGKVTVSNDGSVEIFAGTPTAPPLTVPTPTPTVPGAPSLKITSLGNVDIKANGSINLDAGLGVNVNSGGLVTVGSQAGTVLNSVGPVATNAASIVQNGLPLLTTNPTGGDISIVVPMTALPTPPIPFVPATPAPGLGAPFPNAYADGVPGADGGGAV